MDQGRRDGGGRRRRGRPGAHGAARSGAVPLAPARDAAFVALARISRGGAFASLTLNQIFAERAGLSPQDRGLATELVYGVLRHRRRLDRALAPLVRRGLARTHPAVLRALRFGAFELLFLDRIPPEVSVDQAVNAAKRHGGGAGARAGGFVNAVLRQLAVAGEPALPDRDAAPEAYLREVASLPDWIAERLLARLGPEQATRFADALIERAPTTLCANPARTTRETLAAALAEAHPGTEIAPTTAAPHGLRVRGLVDPVASPLHGAGQFIVQDEGSQLAAQLLHGAGGGRLLDACAGRGGKTLYLAGLAAAQEGPERVEIVAADVDPSKLRTLQRRAATAGHAGIATEAVDLEVGAGALATRGPFARILVDAPCSGLGVLRRHPEAKWRLEPAEIAEHAARQRRILETVAPLLAPGGVLVYAVCSFTTEEGPDVVRTLLAGHPELAVAAPSPGAAVDFAALADPGGLGYLTRPDILDSDCLYLALLQRGR